MKRTDGPLVCLSIAPGSPAEAEEATCAPSAADAMELRLDALPPAALSPETVRGWVAAAAAPLIVTCRPRWQGGGFAGSEERRRQLLQAALDAGARWIDVELDAEWVGELAAERAGSLVVSHHWERPLPTDLDARVKQLLDLRPGIGKLVAPANRPADARPLLAAGRRLAEAGVLPACFAMGEQGSASRLIAALEGGAIYVRDGDRPGTATGQWSLRALADELGVGRWSSRGERYGLVGDPVTHSLSPAVFNAAFMADGNPACYLPLPGRPFEDVLALAREAGFRGLSVTMPYKRQAAAACDELSPPARRIGAVNTLVRTDGGWEGHNTDGEAVVRALAEQLEVAGAVVAMVGAGGAARAAAFALGDAGAKLVVLNRTVERARRLAEEVGAVGWGRPEDLGEIACDALVNATPVGMNGTARTPVSTARLRGGEVVMEMVYRPRVTALLREARARGCRVVPGVEMFLRQAEAQYAIWLGERPPSGVMREAAMSRL